MAYILQGRPLALETFRAYTKALYLLSNLKLGHHLKIPPRSIFIIQDGGYHLRKKNICEPDKLPKGSPWTCPNEHVVFDGTVQSGSGGTFAPIFPHGRYWWTHIFFAVGMIATVAAWKLSRVLLSTPLIMPPATPVYVWAWAGLGIFFNIYVFRKNKEWWAKYNYVLSASLNVGPAFLALLQSFAFQGNNIYGVDWWGLELGDHCPLATCYTFKGIVIEGCPVFS
ncbi:oligopeptide transporter 1 [Cinnamomum micranthum f. kanehirae]|uniref:Oligopeptide transporter 1 n=1 Tax=Cinnamomum micranthum f. kanehirae TaxID=337451 RepID=A0A3S3QJ27_9MAGN|nr:oligopeptide transporter 1 [Cinnamomum micranthum f. kanehirae]